MNEKELSELQDLVWDRLRDVIKQVYQAGYKQGQKELQEQEINDRDFFTSYEEARAKWELPEYHLRSHQTFVVNMHNAGYELRHYTNTRVDYCGPAVIVNRESAARALKQVGVPCTEEISGRKVVIFPK